MIKGINYTSSVKHVELAKSTSASTQLVSSMISAHRSSMALVKEKEDIHFKKKHKNNYKQIIK